MKKLLLLLFMFAGFNVFGQSENFEGGTFPPTGWTTFETGTGFVQSWAETSVATLTYGGVGKSAYMNRENVSTGLAIDWLVTNQLIVPANGQLRFQTKTVQSGNQGSLFDVKISTTSQTNPASFTNLVSWNEDSLTTTANVYEEKVIDLPTTTYPAGTPIYIAFVMTNDNGDRWLIDNVNLIQKCATPIGPLSTTGETTNSALLSWGNPAGSGITQWQVEVVPFASTFNNTPNQPLATTNVNFLASGLAPSTLYKFQVRSVCSNGFESDWFGPRSFQTTSFGDTCGGPIVIPPTLPYQVTDNTGNHPDTNDIAQPLACSGTATNYMQGNDVFYTFTPNFSGNIAITLTPTNASSSIHVYSACPGTAGATCLAGVANATANPRNIIPFPVTSGTTYYIIISSSGGGAQTVGYTLTIQQVFCNQPTGLTATNITTTSADISWAAAAGITSWEYSVAPAPYGLPTGAGTSTNSNTGNTIPGIPGISYQYYVRANCNDGNYSIWSGPFTYTLPQVPTPLNFVDGFETLTGWTLSNGSQSNKWAVGTGINNGGTHSLYITDSNGTTNTYNNTATSVVHAYKDFVIPAGATQLDFTFDWRSNGEAATDYFRVWTVPGAFTPTTGAQITALANSRINVGSDFSSSSNFATQNYTLNATPYAGGTMRVVFEWRNNNALGNQPPAAIDNIKLDLVPCPKPMNPTISNINYNNAQVNWANGATETEWEVLVLAAGSAAPTAASTGVQALTNGFVITGLNSVTCYDVYVRAVCSPTSKSFWSTVATFCTTPHFCAGDHYYDIGGTTGNYNNNQNAPITICPDTAGNVVTVIFNSFNVAAGDNLVIRDGNLITSPILGTYTGTNLPPSFTATSASGCLTFVFTSNATGVAPGWDATIICTPPITCPKPTNLTTANVTTNSVEMTWTENGTATQWEVVVLPLGSPVPSPGTVGVTANTNNPFIYNVGLNPGTAYTYFVRAICSPTDASFYSNGANFYTKPVNDECATALSVPVNNDMNCTVVTPGTITGATNSGTPASTCGGTADDDTWFTFTATSAAHIINFNDIVGNTTDLSHAVYSGTCGALTLMYCDVNNFSYNNTFVIGQTYYIRVWSAATTANQTASFNVCINKVAPPLFAENSSTPTVPATYTVPQLVTDVLVTSPCGVVSNITYSTGTNFGQENGIGYFNKNGSGFGLDEGIILATRSANTCDGPNTAGSEGTAGWPGDPQLLAYMQSLGIDTGLTSYNNSSILEFDFVPIADQIKFDFIFASDEYGTYQCSFSDAFAFFLKNVATGVTTNLAVIPGTSPAVPVAVTTIRKTEYNSGCASANPTYFDKFYGAGTPQNGLPDVIAPTNFKGYTVPMSATGTVIPGQTYHMKFVVGDRNDSSFDSAVFLSKFDIGNVDLGNDLTVTGNSALCVGQSYTIDSGLTNPPYEFVWYFQAPGTTGFTEIIGQTGPTLNVTTPGEYKVVAHYIGSACVGEDTILVEFYPDLMLNTPEPNDLSICTAGTTASFDLTQNTPVVLANFATPSDYLVSYYLTQSDAIAGINAIAAPNAYTNISNPQTIWMRVYSIVTFCSGVKNFDIEVTAPPTADIVYNSAPYCFNDNIANVTQNGTTGGNYSIVGNPANITVDNSGTVTWTNLVTPGSYTVYYEVGSGTCSANDSFTINIESPITSAFTSSNTTICDGSSLTVTLNGTPGATVTYNDGSSNLTVVLDASGNATINHTGGTITYTLVSVTLGSCTQPLSGNVTVSVNAIPQFTIPANLTFCAGSSNTISINPINFNLSDATYAWTFNNIPLPDTTSSIIVNQSGTYSVTVTNIASSCFSSQTSVVNSIAIPVADILANVNACDEYILPALSAGNSYHTAANGSGVQLNAGDAITSSQTIYIFAQTATSPNCTDESSFNVVIVASPNFDITGECDGSQFVLTANVANPQDYSFEWTNSANVVVGSNSNTLPVNEPGTYSCTITNLTGVICQKQVSQLFDNIFCEIQKGISPNGDNMNDYLELRAHKVQIFNRYGKEVYTKENYNNDWHGQFMGGGDMPDGTYYYVIELSSGSEKKTGWIYINRKN